MTELTPDFKQKIDEALDTLGPIPACCDERGKVLIHRDNFFGRVRTFRILCPEGHDTRLRVWAPPGKKWSA